MAIKLNLEKLNNEIQSVMDTIAKAGGEVQNIAGFADVFTDQHRKGLVEKVEENYTTAIQETLNGMKEQIKTDVDRAKVTKDIDFAEQTYYATAVKQEIEGLTTTQLIERYPDIVARGNEPMKKEFERLAVAMMKNAGDDSSVITFKQKMYQNMTEAEKDAEDTRAASETFLYNVGIVEQQANTLLRAALNGENANADILSTIWEQGKANAERNVESVAKLV